MTPCLLVERYRTIDGVLIPFDNPNDNIHTPVLDRPYMYIGHYRFKVVESGRGTLYLSGHPKRGNKDYTHPTWGLKLDVLIGMLILRKKPYDLPKAKVKP